MAQWSSATLTVGPVKLSDMCNVDASGNAIPSRTLIGHLSQVRDSYFVQDDSGVATLVSQCFKGGCAPFPRTLVMGRVGEPVQAEFCGNHPARLAISGVEVYRLTQQLIDENITAIQHMRSRMQSVGAVWFAAWVLFQVGLEWLGRRRTAV